jgi:phenylpropionate dioxygenase-like ring-hydroxylating dioxygenase large terminal subunit
VTAIQNGASGAAVATDLSPLRRYWHPVAREEEVTDRPVAIQLLGEPVVLFRSQGRISAFKDLCLHRGAKISAGTIRNENIVCPYHGFAYDGTGACTYIPSQPRDQQRIPSRLRLIPYHAEVRQGMVWVALEDPVLPIPEWPEYDDESFRTWRALHTTWNASAARVMENALDITHFPWVHEGILGDPDHPEVEEFEVRRTEAGLEYEFDWTPPSAHYAAAAKVHYRYKLFFPFTIYLQVYDVDRAGDELTAIWMPVFPISETESMVSVYWARNHSFDKPDSDWDEMTKIVWGDDQAVVEQQHPEMLPVDLSEEIHLRVGDAPGIAFRQFLRECGLAYA